jgi:hypothetical protein
LRDREIDEILSKYKAKLKGKIDKQYFEDYEPSEDFSREYEVFRKESISRGVSIYEKLCNISEAIIRIKPSKKDYNKLRESIGIAHLRINPEGSMSFSALIIAFLVLLCLLFGFFFYYIDPKSLIPLFFGLLILISLLLFKPLANLPNYLASRWRLRVSNQMVVCILYIVVYMRHTSNLEHGIKFAADHIGTPLSLDLRKIFWDIEVGKYSTIKESLDSYLEIWRKYNLEFVDSFHLIESSLYEPSDSRRLDLLDKSLNSLLL